ncbi:hypothetical protein [Streptomyces sp. NPDC060027]|uniref:hypothetical protein n=1 Tax=Streptomyces sp. NPDC060027 TaxID=3347040 RepID=UPI00368CC867
MLFIGDVPVHWAGPLNGVIYACQHILDLDPHIVVPGHGPLVGPAEVRTYMNFVGDIRTSIHALHARGLDTEEASRPRGHELVGQRPRVHHPHRQPSRTRQPHP